MNRKKNKRGNHRISAPDAAVADARELRKCGHSCATIAAAITETYEITVSRHTIYDWVKGRTRSKVQP